HIEIRPVTYMDMVRIFICRFNRGAISFEPVDMPPFEKACRKNEAAPVEGRFCPDTAGNKEIFRFSVHAVVAFHKPFRTDIPPAEFFYSLTAGNIFRDKSPFHFNNIKIDNIILAFKYRDLPIIKGFMEGSG